MIISKIDGIYILFKVDAVCHDFLKNTIKKIKLKKYIIDSNISVF